MRDTRPRIVLRVAVGAAVGLLVAVPLYLLAVDWLEQRSGPLREAQGLAWNLMLLGAVVGGLIGGLVHRHSPRHPG